MIKEKLMSAVKVAAANYNEGMSASESVAKAAEAADLTMEQAYRLTEMTNTLFALNKEKDAEDPAGSCELASKDEVARILLGTGQEKSASAAPPAGVDYSFYGTNPKKTNATMSKRAEAVSGIVKRAAAEKDAERVPRDLDMSQESLYAAIDKSISILKTAGDAANDVVRGLNIEIERGLGKIAGFAESTRTSDDAIDMFKAACANEDVMKMACELSTRLAASTGGRYASAAVIPTTSDVDEMLKESEAVSKNLTLLGEYGKKRDYFIGKAAEFTSQMRKIVGLEGEAQEKRASISDMVDFSRAENPFAKAGSDRPNSESRAASDVSAIMKKAGIDVNLEDDLEKGAAFPTIVPAVNFTPAEAMNAVSGTNAVSDERRRILNTRREMLLADLMTNDPIISEADPGAVAEAYKTMVMTSPRVSLDKAQVRAFLRSAVNSVAVSPADAKILADVDKNTGINNSLERLTAFDSSIKDSNL